MSRDVRGPARSTAPPARRRARWAVTAADLRLRRWSLAASALAAVILAATVPMTPVAAEPPPGLPQAAREALRPFTAEGKSEKVPAGLQAAATRSAGRAGSRGWVDAGADERAAQVLAPADVRADGLVVVEVTATSVRGLERALGDRGAVQRMVGDGEFRVAVEPDRLDELADAPAVVRIAPRSTLWSSTVVSEGATYLDVASRHDVGLRGGVDVAIVDGGFAGWAEAQAAGELPAPASEMSYCPNLGFRGDDHGTAVAEILHDVAPDARLHLVCIEDASDFELASRYVQAEGITIANASGGFVATGFGNGREAPGSPWHVVDEARTAGVFWAVSAGNTGEHHWGGRFVDTDGDDIHEFGPEVVNTVTVPAGAVFAVTLRWDEFDAPRTDLDLFVLDDRGTVVGESVSPQLAGYAPAEEVWLQNRSSTAATFHLGVGRYAGTEAPDMDVFVQGTSPLRHRTVNRSVLEPATSPGAFAVGSICAANGVPQPFSAAGPTADGRTKPDAVSFDAVSGYTYGASRATCQGGFPGTSAAAPHVAGVAALVAQAHPDWGPAQIADHLRATAVDLGDPGPDNGTGWGRLRLGDLSVDDAGGYDPDGPAGTIYRLYRAYFLREPDAAGFGHWVAVHRDGYPLGKISNDFARSDEFQDRYGTVDDQRFLALVYENVLGREPDASGRAYWDGHLRDGMLRGELMLYFSDSDEFRALTAGGTPPGA